jgi:hypothetical protein
VQEERKKDVEETADFIKEIINAGKQDTARELSRIAQDVERIRRELQDRPTA